MLSVAFCEFLSNFTHPGHIYKAGRVLFVCIGANKGLNDFSMKNEVMLIFFLLEHCSSLVTGITHFICCGSQKQGSWCICICVGWSFMSLTFGPG